MKKVLLSLVFCMVSLVVFPQAFNQQKAIQEISRAASSISTMECDFVQTKSLKMLGSKMVSKGKMYCQQPNKLRWEYVTPYTYTFILNGAQVSLKKGTRHDVIDVNKNKMFKEIARIMMNSVLGKCLTDKKDFSASASQSGNSYVVTLHPLKKGMKQMFTKIVLHYDKRQAFVNRVVLHEKNGDTTDIELKNINKNASINASKFKIN